MADEISIVVRAEDQFSNVLGNFGNIMTGIKSTIDLVAGAFDAAVDFIRPFVDSAAESELTIAKLEAVLIATGGAAGVTSEQMQEMANGLQQVTRFGDETILTGATLLLTFRNISGETLERAVPAMLDMAEIFGSVDSAAMQLGKALNDPVNMLGALSRAGVTFSEEQKEMIKNFVEMGDVAAAQNIILTEVENQVGNVAEAVGQTFTGQWEIAKNKLDEVRELIGGPVINALGTLLTAVFEFAETNPAIQAFIGFFTRWNELLSDDVPLLYSLGLALREFASGSATVDDIGIAFMRFSNALYAGATPLEAFKTALDGIAASTAGTTLGNIIVRIQEFITTAETQGLGTAFSDLFSDAWASMDLTASFQALLDRLSTLMGGADWGGIGQVIGNVLSSAIQIALEGLDAIVNDIDWGPFGAALKTAINEMVDGMFDNTNLGQSFFEAVSWLWTGGRTEIMEESKSNLMQMGREMIQGLIDGINSVEMNITNWVRDHIVTPIKQFLGIASPSTLFYGIGQNLILGLMGGMASLFGTLPLVMAGFGMNIVQGLWDGFKNVLDRFFTWLNSVAPQIISIIQPLLDVFGIEVNLPTGTTGGGTTGAGTAGGGVSGTVNNYYYGPVYFQGAGEPGAYYDCPSPNPFMTAGSGTIVATGYSVGGGLR